MTIFDQNNQNVHGNQYNVGGDIIIKFAEVNEKSELPFELSKVITVLREAETRGVIDAKTASESEKKVAESIDEIRKPEPNVRDVIEKLNGAKTLIEGLTSAGGLVKMLIEAAEMVRKFFG
jgi:hypothetical protein